MAVTDLGFDGKLVGEANPLPVETSDGPADDFFAIVPSDGVDFAAPVRAIYVGAAGNVTAVSPLGSTATFKAVPAGTTLRVRATKVKATGTTAGDMVGLL